MLGSTRTTRFRFWILLTRLIGVIVPRRLRAEASDPITYAMVAGLLLVTAFVACVVPARRATKTDPMVVLRHE
jgi:hypothetical protein